MVNERNLYTFIVPGSGGVVNQEMGAGVLWRHRKGKERVKDKEKRRKWKIYKCYKGKIPLNAVGQP